MSIFQDRFASFYDPFAKDNLVVGASDEFPNSKLRIDAPPPYRDSNVKILEVTSAPSAWGSDTSSYPPKGELPIHGQGTVIANCTAPSRLLFTFTTGDQSKPAPSLYVEIQHTSVYFGYGPTLPEDSIDFLPPDRVEIKGNVVEEPQPADENKETLNELTMNKRVVTFLRPDMSYPARYWVSIDHTNGILRFGRDFANLTFTMYEARLKHKVSKDVLEWTDSNHAFIKDLTTVKVQQTAKAPHLQLVYQPMPVVAQLPPIIVPSDSITLDQLATGSVTVPANLPSTACQRLYANVAGSNIRLDTPDFPDFSQAIKRSVNTKGLLCNQMLKEKAMSRKKDYRTTYLRITLGANLGNSPGAPYVLEIWPALHHSPIHDHGKAHAIIKVLHGNIKAYYFTALNEDVHPIGPPAKLQKGDITWIDENHYQVHMLSNESKDGSVCCTIQCYAYGEEDVRHYEAFDYLDDGKIVHQFYPNSDMSFGDFKAALKEEWSNRWRNSPEA